MAISKLEMWAVADGEGVLSPSGRVAGTIELAVVVEEKTAPLRFLTGRHKVTIEYDPEEENDGN